jgi:uncharacterized membrane protein SpoIIM required for sporulation
MTIAFFFLLWIVGGFFAGSFVGNIIAQNANPLDEDHINN